MAKIRVQDNIAVDLPSEQGYINVVDNLFLNTSGAYQAFLSANESQRPDLLKAAVGSNHHVTHIPVGASPEEISNANSRIVAEPDLRKPNPSGKSRFTMPIPDTQPTGVDYLKAYAVIIYRLYHEASLAEELAKFKEDQAVLKDTYGLPNEALALRAKAAELRAGADESRTKAHKFMFGVMTLTRCR